MKVLRILVRALGVIVFLFGLLMFWAIESDRVFFAFIMVGGLAAFLLSKKIGAKEDAATRSGDPRFGGRYEKTSDAFQRDRDREYCATLQKRAKQITTAAPMPDRSLGFQNFPAFVIKGKKASTKRMNTLRIRARDAESACRIVMSSKGLIEPLEISQEAFLPASGKNAYGISIPAEACQDDEDALLWSVTSQDDHPIPAGFMKYLTLREIPMSWLSGRNRAAEAVLKTLDDKSKAELYGYAVDCSIHNWTPGNMLESPRISLYVQFADAASKDARVLMSISSRPGSDIWDPAKNTIAYKFAQRFFS